MQTDRIVLAAHTYDQGDILDDYLQWHLDLGVHFIVVQDFGSTDNSRDVLDRFAGGGRVAWFTLPERDMQKYDSATEIAAVARDRYDADWIIQSDADEFLCPEGEDLNTFLQRAKEHDITVLSVPRFNMTGSLPNAKQSAQQTLTLRIDRPTEMTGGEDLSDTLGVPRIFMKHPPKTIVRAGAVVDYGPGTHTATSSWGQTREASGLRFLHYPMRGFEKFEEKIQNTEAWLADNPHLGASWGWHWRRWVRLYQNGRLREEYEDQFVSPMRARELIREGICSLDETVADWISRRT